MQAAELREFLEHWGGLSFLHTSLLLHEPRSPVEDRELSTDCLHNHWNQLQAWLAKSPLVARKIPISRPSSPCNRSWCSRWQKKNVARTTSSSPRPGCQCTSSSHARCATALTCCGAWPSCWIVGLR